MLAPLLIILDLAPGQPPMSSPAPLVAPVENRCPTEFEPLVIALIQDLPSYSNRAIQRSASMARSGRPLPTVITAGRPEFEPLPLPFRESIPEDPRQVFVTTLERTYLSGQAVDVQVYHWIFLTQTKRGWRLAFMFSRIGPKPDTGPITPPQDTSHGAIAQAIRTWLRDCQWHPA